MQSVTFLQFPPVIQCSDDSEHRAPLMQWRVGGVPHPELIGPELVNVGAFPGHGLVPEAELQQELIPA